MPTNPKVTSFIAKFAVLIALGNKTPTKEEMGYCIGLCLNHRYLRDKFFGINEELAELGYKRAEVLNNALRYCKNDDKPNNVVYVPVTYEPEIDQQVNKNYFVVRNAGCAHSRYTLKLSLIFKINQSIN